MQKPKSSVVSNLYTNGNEFQYIENTNNTAGFFEEASPASRLKVNYSEYIGYYHEYSNGRFFSGPTPESANKVELYKIDHNYEIDNIAGIEDPSTYESLMRIYMGEIGDNENLVYDPVSGNNLSKYSKYFNQSVVETYLFLAGGDRNMYIRHPLFSKTFPTPENYENEYFLRYFCIKNNEARIIEVNYDDYKRIKDKKLDMAFELFTAFSLKWKLVSSSRKEVISVNKQLVKNLINSDRFTNAYLNRYIYSLEQYFEGNYDEYYQISPGVILANNRRSYIEGDIIPFNLPEVYQLGNNKNNIINNKVPPKQNCSNCSFFKSGNCLKWRAKIKNNYWCKSYNGTEGKGYIIEQPNQEETPQQTLNQEYITLLNNQQPNNNNINTPNYSSGGGGY